MWCGANKSVTLNESTMASPHLTPTNPQVVVVVRMNQFIIHFAKWSAWCRNISPFGRWFKNENKKTAMNVTRMQLYENSWEFYEETASFTCQIYCRLSIVWRIIRTYHFPDWCHLRTTGKQNTYQRNRRTRKEFGSILSEFVSLKCTIKILTRFISLPWAHPHSGFTN